MTLIMKLSTDINNWIDSHLPAPLTLEKRFDQLFPLCRSLTGNGVRRTLDFIRESIPLELVEVPTGTKVFDWTVPMEWNIKDAYLADEAGTKWIDMKDSNLHVVGYSVPVNQTISYDELQSHLHSLPHQPDAIPYLTTYYEPKWGFCLTDTQRKKLPRTNYRAVIDSTLKPGSLTYGHLELPSTTGGTEEILISTYVCHPSMANNELSGPLVATAIYEALSQLPTRKYRYRFVFCPETIGTLAYLSKHSDTMKSNCIAGLVVTCCGDNNNITYKRSRKGDSLIDRAVEQVLIAHKNQTGKSFSIFNFFPSGSDERQYCSPGFNLPVGSLMRSMYDHYEEYHTSKDNKDFISFEAIRESVGLYLHSILSLELNETYVSNFPYGEPMLNKHGLYPGIGAQKQTEQIISQIFWILNYSDGDHDLLSIAQKAGTSVTDLAPQVQRLLERKIIRRKE